VHTVEIKIEADCLTNVPKMYSSPSAQSYNHLKNEKKTTEILKFPSPKMVPQKNPQEQHK
jgi:hypothetical protein